MEGASKCINNLDTSSEIAKNGSYYNGIKNISMIMENTLCIKCLTMALAAIGS